MAVRWTVSVVTPPADLEARIRTAVAPWKRVIVRGRLFRNSRALVIESYELGS